MQWPDSYSGKYQLISDDSTIHPIDPHTVETYQSLRYQAKGAGFRNGNKIVDRKGETIAEVFCSDSLSNIATIHQNKGWETRNSPTSKKGDWVIVLPTSKISGYGIKFRLAKDPIKI